MNNVEVNLLHDVMQLRTDIMHLSRSFHFFEKSHRTLIEHLQTPEHDNSVSSDFFQNQRFPLKRTQYLFDLNNNSFSAATSITALVASAKILERYRKNNKNINSDLAIDYNLLYDLYNTKNDEIMKTPDFYFWRKMRNYITHHSSQYPWAWSSELFSLGKNPNSNIQISTKIFLKSTSLLQHNWTTKEDEEIVRDHKMIEYLNSHEQDIYLKNIIVNYRVEMIKIWQDVIDNMLKLEKEKAKIARKSGHNIKNFNGVRFERLK